MLSLSESASSLEGAGPSAFTRERKFFSTSSLMMSLPFTTAQTPGPGAVSFWQDVRRAQAVRAGRRRNVRFKELLPRRPASGSLLHAASTDACGADADVLVSAVNDSFHAPQIRIPAAPSDVMGVADLVAVTRFFAAEFTRECHVALLQTRRHWKIVDFDPTRERPRQEAIWSPRPSGERCLVTVKSCCSCSNLPADRRG